MADNANKVKHKNTTYVNTVFAAVGILYLIQLNQQMLLWNIVFLVSFGLSLTLYGITSIFGCCKNNRIIKKWLQFITWILIVFCLIFIFIQYGLEIYKKLQKEEKD